MDENNICEHLKLQYKLLNVIFKLKYGRIVLKCAFILRLSKSLSDHHTLNVFAVEAHNLAKTALSSAC